MRVPFFASLILVLSTTTAFADSPAARSGPAAEDGVAACETRPAPEREDCLSGLAREMDEAGSAESTRARKMDDAYRHELADHLAASGSARDKLLAAELLNMERYLRDAGLPAPSGSHPEEILARDQRVAGLARMAARMGRDDVQVQWTMASGQFDAVAPELKTPAIAAMRRLQPDNLAVWLLADDYRSPIDASILAKAAASRHHDMAYLQRLAWITDAHLAHLPSEEMLVGIPDLPRPTAEQVAIAHALGVAMSGPFPALNHLTAACKPGAVGLTEVVQEDCRRIATILSDHSDTFVALSLGLQMAKVLARDQTELETAWQKRRIYNWQMARYAELMQGHSLAEILSMSVDGVNEPGATEPGRVRAWLVEAGIALTPPPDWQPSPPPAAQAD